MKTCPVCNTGLPDDALFCTNCGARFTEQSELQGAVRFDRQPSVQDIYDHTAEFSAKDISDNKVFAMLGYLLGIFGVIIALLASHSSEYTMFHVRQSLKLIVADILLLLCIFYLAWTFIVPFAGLIMLTVFRVIKIICFFGVCSGKAKEPVIIRSLKFLK